MSDDWELSAVIPPEDEPRGAVPADRAADQSSLVRILVPGFIALCASPFLSNGVGAMREGKYSLGALFGCIGIILFVAGTLTTFYWSSLKDFRFFSSIGKISTNAWAWFILLIFVFFGLRVGVDLNPFQTTDLTSTTHVSPSAEDTNKAIAERDAAIRERDAARRDLEVARRQSVQPSASVPSQSVLYLLDGNLMRVLLPEIALLRPKLPQILLTMAQDVSAQGNMRQFKSLFDRAGIRVDVEGQQPTGPEQSGVMLAVRDINNPPEIALQLAGLLRKVGFEMKVVSLVTTGGSKEEFSIFIGPPPL